jgi:hypothetical protein
MPPAAPPSGEASARGDAGWATDGARSVVAIGGSNVFAVRGIDPSVIARRRQHRAARSILYTIKFKNVTSENAGFDKINLVVDKIDSRDECQTILRLTKLSPALKWRGVVAGREEQMFSNPL